GSPWLARRIVERWTEVVKDDIQKKAFTDEEADEVLGNPLLAYGATLLTALVTDDFILYLQMGDGDILVVSETGDVSRAIAKDSDLIANETYSLCMTNAPRFFRFGFQPLSNALPALIMLSSDGYSNSFRTEEDFFKAAKDILEIARTEGEGAILQDLGTWLKDTSEQGSGDDITLGAIFREDVLRLQDGEDEHSHGQVAEAVPRDPEETGNANILT
ncbi:MAG: protein phosphatase 2C domain-containing protein, partial [Syntrophobacteraceae bacterium]